MVMASFRVSTREVYPAPNAETTPVARDNMRIQL